MLWNPVGQLMAVGDSAFIHEGPINTAPSHDLAHLLVAASSPKLAWKPAGLQAQIAYAEYNAVVFEHTLDRIYRAYVDKQFAPETIVRGLVSHLDWFVTKHFLPFPCTPREALRQYLSNLLDDSAVRLSPYFFQMKYGERLDPDYMKATWTARFRDSDSPIGWHDLQVIMRTQLGLLRASEASMSSVVSSSS
jgi:hypothetical protein